MDSTPAWAASFVKCCICGALLFPVALGVVLLLAAPIAVLSGVLWLGASSVWPAQAAHAGPITFIVTVGVAAAMVACAAFLCARRMDARTDHEGTGETSR